VKDFAIYFAGIIFVFFSRCTFESCPPIVSKNSQLAQEGQKQKSRRKARNKLLLRQI